MTPTQTPIIVEVENQQVQLRMDYRAIKSMQIEHNKSPMQTLKDLESMNAITVGNLLHAALVSGAIYGNQKIKVTTAMVDGLLNNQPTLFGQVATFAINELAGLFKTVEDDAEKKGKPVSN